MTRNNPSEEEFLAPEVVQQIFPVAPRDRRINADLFSRIVDRERLRENEVFYKNLAEALRGDLKVIREYDQRLIRARDTQKTFGARSFRYIFQATNGKLKSREICELPDDHFPANSVESAVLTLFKRLSIDDDDSADHSGAIATTRLSDADDSGPQVTGWRALAVELVREVSALSAPQPNLAVRILDLAKLLKEACEAEAAAIAKAEAEQVRLHELMDRLIALDPSLAEAADRLLVAQDSPDADVVSAAIEALEKASDAVRNAESHLAELQRDHKEAFKTQDLDRQEALLPKLRSAQSRRQASAEVYSTTLNALRTLLSTSDENPIQHVRRAEIALVKLPESGSGLSDVAVADELKQKPSSTVGLEVESEMLVSDAAAEPVVGPPHVSCAEVRPQGNGSAVAPTRSSCDDAETASLVSGAILNDLVVQYLTQSEPALAWHLSELAEERGHRQLLPPPLLKALAIASSFSRPEDMAEPLRPQILAEAMAALASVENEGTQLRIELARSLALAALLRPALFDMNNIARGHLANLSLEGPLQRYAPLVMGFVELGYEVRISIEDLAEFGGNERERRLPAARAALRVWLEAARTRKVVHQPTYRILHWQLDPEGELGRVIEGAIADRPDATRMAQELVDRLLDDRAAQERFVADSERAKGRPRRDRIKGMSLDWFCERLQEACVHLRDWLAAHEADATVATDRQGAVAARIGSLRKHVTDVLAVDEEGGQDVPAAVALTLRRALDDIGGLLGGRVLSGPRAQLHWFLDAPLLRLPGGCQPWWQSGEAFDAERKTQRALLFDALRSPKLLAQDFRSAFPARLGDRATLAARQLLQELETVASGDTPLAGLKQELDEVITISRAAARDDVERLRQDLATLMNLDLGTPEKVHAELDRLEGIARAIDAPIDADEPLLPALNGVRQPDVPPDFPELKLELSRIEEFRTTLLNRIREEQRERLSALSSRAESTESVRLILERLETLDPVTVDDMIADLQSGRQTLTLDDRQDDGFARFFPDFVAGFSDRSALNRGQILRAIENRDSLEPLDFSMHDSTELSSAKRLVETWAEAENSLTRGTPHQLREATRRLLGLIGFTSVQVGRDRELVPGRLRSFQLDCDVPKAERWFLPPAFGSEASGSYPLLLARPEVSDDQLSSELGRLGPDRASLLFVFGRINRRRRESIARILRRDRRVVLLLDETLLLYLAMSRGNAMEQLFTCAMPFAWTQPYTTNPGAIAPEMFFGRREEMATILARRSGGCLVYGGRQLGKSALLNHIRRLHHQPEEGQVAIYLDIKPIGSAVTLADRIWTELAHALNEARVVSERQSDPRYLETGIRKWLEVRVERRLLIMLDEADRFLRAEHAAGYPNLQRLKTLMEATDWRCKVVFAGLHNVRRMAQAPNSPLVHLGNPICIGPLNASPESQVEARRLAMAPMRAAGFEYDPPSLAWDMLARMNHFPSLVQVFCKSVIETANSQPRPVGDGPRWRLGRQVLFEGRSARAIADEIRKRFQWTLDLDPRYDLITKVIALHRFDDPDGNASVLRRGLNVAEIEELAAAWWPSAMGMPRPGDIEELLAELVDLGVLSAIAPGRFGLRNAHIAQMMGQRDEIERAILALSEREPDVDYDPATFHPRVRMVSPLPRAPLPDRLLQQLFDPRSPGIRVLAVAPDIVGPETAESLLTLADSWEMEGLSSRQVHRHRGKPDELRRLVERAQDGTHILVIETAWDSRVVDWLVQQAAVADGRVLPIWIVPAEHLVSSTSGRVALKTFRAGVWSEPMLRHWLHEEGLSALDDRNTRAAILHASGGAPALLQELRPVLEAIAAEAPETRPALLNDWSEQHQLRPGQVGLPEELVSSLADLATFGELKTREELDELFGDRAGHVVHVTAALGLAEASPEGGLRLTPLGRAVRT